MHSAKTLPSARKKTLGKDAFAVTFFTECGLPSATLGKPFAECKRAFAECIRHSANKASPVVTITFLKEGSRSEYGDGRIEM